MLKALREGRPGTAMKSFRQQLTEQEMHQVVMFVRDEFMTNKRENTRYHIPENGWFNHEVNRDAFTFALGEIALDTPWEDLTEQQRAGKELFMRSCVTCHDRAQVENEGVIWEARPLSYPRNQYSHLDPDAVSEASPYALHDRAALVQSETLDVKQQKGKFLFEQNCAFCHAADGSGKNWIGSFIQPHPRNLSDTAFLSRLEKPELMKKIANGVEGTAMPAWKTVLSNEQIEALAEYLLSQKI